MVNNKHMGYIYYIHIQLITHSYYFFTVILKYPLNKYKYNNYVRCIDCELECLREANIREVKMFCVSEITYIKHIEKIMKTKMMQLEYQSRIKNLQPPPFFFISDLIIIRLYTIFEKND